MHQGVGARVSWPVWACLLRVRGRAQAEWLSASAAGCLQASRCAHFFRLRASELQSFRVCSRSTTPSCVANFFFPANSTFIAFDMSVVVIGRHGPTRRDLGRRRNPCRVGSSRMEVLGIPLTVVSLIVVIIGFVGEVSSNDLGNVARNV